MTECQEAITQEYFFIFKKMKDKIGFYDFEVHKIEGKQHNDVVNIIKNRNIYKEIA